jgi:hypothetical protein
MNRITSNLNNLSITSAYVLGQIRAVRGIIEMSSNVQAFNKIIDELNDKIIGFVSYDKLAITKFLVENPSIIDMIQKLIILRQIQMGRAVERTLPSSLNSYILIVASILVEETPDLTFGTSNVSDSELDTYFKQHPLGVTEGGKSLKSRRRRQKKRVNHTRRSRKTKKSHKKRRAIKRR